MVAASDTNAGRDSAGDRAGAHDVHRGRVRVGGRRPDGIIPQGGLRLGGDRDKLVDILLVHGPIQRVSRGHRADQDQHDEAHAFLPVIRAVREAHAGAGQYQQSPDPGRAAAGCPWAPGRAREWG